MPRLLKKFLFSFFASLVILFSLAPYLSPANAQAWYSQEPIEWYLKVYDKDASPPNEIFGERYTAAQVQWVVYSFIFLPIRMVSGVIGDDVILCFVKSFGTGTLDINNCGGAAIDLTLKVAAIANKIIGKVLPYIDLSGTTTPSAISENKPLVALVFDSKGRELSGIEYSKNLIKKFSPVSEVNAQGFGYTGLNWLQTYWTGFRNISYGLLVLVIIVFAFMIMFRVKLSPQTVVSVQSALPKVILTLILVTFSYAIAGFAIDLMYVVAGLFVILLKGAGFAAANSSNAWLMISGEGAGYSLAGGFWVLFVMLGYAVMFIIAGLVSFVAALVGGFSLFGAVVGLLFAILGLFCFVIMLWYTIKIPYVLLKTLISFYVSVITAPIQILAGALVPSMGFGAWFKKVMADILVFPVTGLFFWFAWSTLWTSFHQAGLDIARGLWVPFTDMWAPGIIGSAHDMSGIIFLAISFGIITEIPKIPDMLKGMILGEKFAFGTAVGEAISGGIGYVSAYTKNKQELGQAASWVGQRAKKVFKRPSSPATPATPAANTPASNEDIPNYDE